MIQNRSLEWLRNPERAFADLISSHTRGDDLQRRHLWRAVVLAVDTEGGLLENIQGSGDGMTVSYRDGSTKTFPPRVGPINPKGSVKARILSDGYDRLLDDADCRTFWPMSPPDQVGMPVSPGEHVYVVFEDSLVGSTEHGMWTARVSGQDSAGSFEGSDSYTAPSYNRTAVDAFAPNPQNYQTDDDSASLAPNSSATKFFGG